MFKFVLNLTNIAEVDLCAVATGIVYDVAPSAHGEGV
jgi:hypothetical protein